MQGLRSKGIVLPWGYRGTNCDEAILLMNLLCSSKISRDEWALTLLVFLPLSLQDLVKCLVFEP